MHSYTTANNHPTQIILIHPLRTSALTLRPFAFKLNFNLGLIAMHYAL
jgi:hypothetical protein